MVVKFLAKKGLGLLGKNKTQAIKSVPPSLTKGESSAVKLHKLKMAIKKGSDTAEDAIRTGVKKFKKSIDKMKEPKKWETTTTIDKAIAKART